MELVSKAIGTILKADSTITDLIPAERMFFGQVPQGTNDNTYLRFTVKGTPRPTKVGAVKIDVYEVIVQIFTVDPWKGARAARFIRSALDRYGAGTVSGIALNDIIFTSGGMIPDLEDDLDHVLFGLAFDARVERS